jgi:hypothetical protein
MALQRRPLPDDCDQVLAELDELGASEVQFLDFDGPPLLELSDAECAGVILIGVEQARRLRLVLERWIASVDGRARTRKAKTGI